MAITDPQKQSVVKDFATHEGDTGSPEVQVAVLTHRINHLAGHLKEHRLDKHNRRGLVMMVGKRNRLLRYLARTDRQRYLDLIGRLGLRK